jgi:pimeloyl-[acyl-carrier protein] synthase
MVHKLDDDEYNFHGAELYADPYPFYHKLRARYPVHLDSHFGCWVVTAYEDVVAAFANRDLSSERAEAGAILRQEGWKELQPLFAHIANLMFYNDIPKHTQIRALINKAFSARMIETWRDRIQKIVDELLNPVQDQGHMDVIRDLALPLPLQTISDMLGIPPEDRSQFKRWSDDLAYFLGNPPTLEKCTELMQSMNDFMTYFRGIVEQHRSNPQDTIVNALLQAEEHGVTLTEDELLINCVGLFVGGHETTMNLIGNGLLALLHNPQQMERLRRQPLLIKSAVEELLRYDSPVQFTARIAKTTSQIRGQKIYRGQKVMLMLGAANRDPQQFPEPDRLDISRQENRHLAFGSNIHYCIGAALARVEGQIAINTLLQRMPQLQLADSPLEWQENLSYHGLKALPVTFQN